MDREDFGYALAAERVRQGLTVSEAARKAGISRAAWHQIENGQEPKWRRAHYCLAALGVYLRIGSQTSRKKLNIPAPKGKA